MKKKSLLAIIVIIVAILLVVPNIVGGGIQSATVQTLLAMVPDQADQVLDIRQTEFRRGWFSSYARIEITAAELEALAGEPVSLILDMDINHGPLLFTSSGVRLGLAHADIDPSITGIQPEDIEPSGEIETTEPSATMFARFDNSVDVSFQLDNFLASNAAARLSANGLRGTSQIQADQSSSAMVELDDLTFALEDGSFNLSIQSMIFSASKTSVAQPISTGESRFVINRASSNAPLPVTVNLLTADYQLALTPEAPDYLSLTQQFRIDQLDWDIPVSSLRWQFQLSHLNRELVDSYLQLIQESQQPGSSNRSQAAARVTALGQDFFVGLISEDFAFDNRFDVDAFEGSHSIQLDIDWPGLAGVADFQDIAPQELLRTVRITLALDADQAALMNSPFAQTVIDYERPGFLIIDNGRVRSTIQLSDGVLDINGELTPLEQFINL